MKKYACNKHVEYAIDDIVNNCETYPIIDKNEEEKCFMCEKSSEYEVKIK